MGQGCHPLPARELCLVHRRIRRDELDRGFGEIVPPKLGQEYHAVVRPSEKAAQGKESIDYLTLPLRPDLDLRHRLPPGGRKISPSVAQGARVSAINDTLWCWLPRPAMP